MKYFALPTLLFFIFLLIQLEPRVAGGYGSEPSPEQKAEQKKIKKKAEMIEIIEGTPTRPFKKIAPMWESSHSLWGLRPNMEKTLQRMKKNAAKMGADAIIEFRMGTDGASVSSGYGFSHGSLSGDKDGISGSSFGSSGWGGISNPVAVLQGWAVQWTGPETQPSASNDSAVLASPSKVQK